MAGSSKKGKFFLTAICDVIASALQRFFVPLFMGALAVIVFFQVLNRFILHIPLPWTEEIGRYLFVWASMLAAASGIRAKAHLNVELVQGVFGTKVKRFLIMLSEFITFAFFAMLSYQGFIWVTRNGFQVRADSIYIPMFYIQVIIPATALLMALFALDALVGLIRLGDGKEGN